MEEIITVDGKQFKLTTDQLLTAEQKAQAIAEIRKQTGCGTCGGQKIVRTASGNIQTMAATCTKTTINGGEVVNLSASPDGGTAPYTVKFLAQFGSTPAQLSGGGLTGSSLQTVLTDGGTTTAVTYTVSDAEIVASAGGAPAAANVDGSGLDLAATATNTVRFIVHTSDSCPTGALHCLESCTLSIVCTTPTCNFIVS